MNNATTSTKVVAAKGKGRMMLQNLQNYPPANDATAACKAASKNSVIFGSLLPAAPPVFSAPPASISREGTASNISQQTTRGDSSQQILTFGDGDTHGPPRRRAARNPDEAVPRTKRWAPKSKTGCITCRHHRIKCDEARPACARCISAKRECSYKLPDLPPHNASPEPVIVQQPTFSSVPCGSQPVTHEERQDSNLLGGLIVDQINGAPPRLSICSEAPFRGTGLKAFDKQIPERLGQRFEDLQAIYCPALYNHILGKRGLLSSRRTKKIDTGVCDFSMKWKYLGESEATAELYMVIQCAEGAGRKVRRFFRQSHVEEDLGTDFRVKVIESGLRRLMLAIEAAASVVGGEHYTLCGRRLQLSLRNVRRQATLGGVVMVTSDSEEYFYAVTAGHPVQELRRLEKVDEGVGDSDSDAMSECSDSEGGDNEESDSESASSIVLEQRPLGPSEFDLMEPPSNFQDSIGPICHDSFKDGSTATNCDWALIPLPPSQLLPNLLRHDKQLFSVLNLPASSHAPAVVLTSRGAQVGKLNWKMTALFMAPGQQLVQTMDFTPNSESHLIHGDSGAWVVSPDHGHVYGHLVAIDAFGEGCVIPLNQTLKDIQQYLGATEVSLPTAKELQRIISGAESEDVSDRGQEGAVPEPEKSAARQFYCLEDAEPHISASQTQSMDKDD
ncbi:hypothetical protein PWT90_04835 [Aphanocladium album]|nr:hypothetical protein PWT90_04835 [Aphanocladium album]